MANGDRRTRRGPLAFRIVRARPRLFGAAGLGLLVAAALFALTTWRPGVRWLVGWDIAVVVYLVAAFHMMLVSDVARIRRRAAEEDEGQLTILALTVAAAVASLGAIVAELGTATGGGVSRQAGTLILASATIVLSWAFIHTIFALHYAHEFYDERHAGGGLAFPGDEKEPDYLDFVYFSFVIGMTSQVSDVGIVSQQIRRTATAHGVISFLFNVALLALTVNIAAGAM